MLWTKDYVTGSGADFTDTSHPFIVSLLLLFSCVFFPSLMIYRLQEHNTGSDERQRDIKKKEERAEGRKEGGS